MLKFASAEILEKTLIPQGMKRAARRAFAHRHHFDYEVRPGFLYVRSRAISSRCNDNFDEFPAIELEAAYKTFLGKPVFVNHINDDHKRARGVIIDAALHKDANRDGSKDWWVEVLMEVDALRFPRLAKEILEGNIARTSMGCDVAYSICSACGNKATTPAEYCRHIPGAKGQRLYRTTASGQKVGELIRETCYGLKFFENSLLVEPPADPTAYFLGVDSRGLDKAASKTAAQIIAANQEGGEMPAFPWDKVPSGHLTQQPRTQGHDDPDRKYLVQHRDTPGHEFAERYLSNPHGLPGRPGRTPKPEIFPAQNTHPQMPTVDPAAHRYPGVQGQDARRIMHAWDTNERTGADPAVRSNLRDQWYRSGYSSDCDGASCPPWKHNPEEAGHGSLFDFFMNGDEPHTAAKDPRFAEVGLGQDEDGHYVKTHRARSDSYPSPEEIPQAEVDRIAATGSKTAVDKPYGDVKYADPGMRGDKARYPIDTPEHIDAAERYIHEKKNQGEYSSGQLHEVEDAIDHAAEEHGIGHHGVLTGFFQVTAIKAVPGEAPTVESPPGAGHENKPYKIVQAGNKFHVVDKDNRAAQWTHDANGVHIHPGHDTEEEANKAHARINAFTQNKTWTSPEVRSKDGKKLLRKASDDPTKHPFYQHHPVHPQHVVDAWNEATPEEHDYGTHWYPHAHEIAKSIALRHPDLEKRHAEAVVSGDPEKKARTMAEAAHKGAGVLSAYSPQVSWWDNQHHAMTSFIRGKAVKSGDGAVGMASGPGHQAAAQRIMNGEHHQNVLGGEKTRKFAKLIENGGTSPDVVVDRHAIAVATGGKMLPPEKKRPQGRQETPEEATARKAHNEKHTFPTGSKNLYNHAESAYHEATHQINAKRAEEGHHPVTPSQVQAVTWLVQQRRNSNQNMMDNARERWREHGNKEIGGGSFNYHLAYGETKAPQDVDTLREDACPVCGDRDTYDGDTCSVCGYVAPPQIFQDPDLEVARQMDLRKNIGDFTGQPGQPVNPDQLGQDGRMTPTTPGQGVDQFDQTGEVQPGGLPGEVQAEVQPAMDGGGNMPGIGNGIPDSDGMVPQDPAGQGLMAPDQLGPDGQPIQQGLGDAAMNQPGQMQPVLGPDGMPVGPQPLPANALSGDGKPFHPGPNMPMGPGAPEGPEGPVSPDMLGPDGQMAQDGQQPDPTQGGGVPGTPGDGVPDLSCPACGFTTDATAPTSIDMDTAGIPPTNMATPDGVQAGDICPNCGGGLLMSPAEVTGQDPMPMPGTAVPPR